MYIPESRTQYWDNHHSGWCFCNTQSLFLCIHFQSTYFKPFRQCILDLLRLSNSSILILSTPPLPRLALTLIQASITNCLSIWNGFVSLIFVPPVLQQFSLTIKNWIIQPLLSTLITRASSLLRKFPPLCRASILSFLQCLRLKFSLRITTTGSHVPCNCLC